MKKEILFMFRRCCLTLTGLAGLSASLLAQDCGDAFYQLKPNTTFTVTTYSPKDKPLSSATHLVKSVDKTSNGQQAEVEMELFDDKDKSIGKNSYQLTCDNGTMQLNMRDFAFQGSAMPANVVVEMSGEELDLPPVLRAGQDLNGAAFNLKAKMGQVKIMDRNFTVKDRKVENVETLDTPAGKFECYKVTYLTETEGMLGKAKTIKTVSWYAKGPGLVRNEFYDDKGKMTGYALLTKYSK